MKSEGVKTAAFVAVAVGLLIAAAWFEPASRAPELLSDQGQPLFPQFRDVLAVKSIEIVAYNEDQAVAIPLKVEFRKGRWVLPSHYDYPAQAEDQLAKTAASLLGLRKDEAVSDRVEDQATYGVIDPLDASNPSLAGRGKRVTLRDQYGAVLADIVLGKPVPNRPGFRYVRLPGNKRIYAVKTDADPSARFEDWVSPNLLQLAADRIRRVTVHRYSIDETLGRVTDVRRTVLVRDNGQWRVEGESRVSQNAIRDAIGTLAGLRIRGVRPKPAPLAEQLARGQLLLTLETVFSLRQRGFFLAPTGRLFANEGEMLVETADGLVYVLRFGEIERGGLGETSEGGSGAAGAQQGRYLLVTVSYDPNVERRYSPLQVGTSLGEQRAQRLNREFANWYYVISEEDFKRLRLGS